MKKIKVKVINQKLEANHAPSQKKPRIPKYSVKTSLKRQKIKTQRTKHIIEPLMTMIEIKRNQMSVGITQIANVYMEMTVTKSTKILALSIKKEEYVKK